MISRNQCQFCCRFIGSVHKLTRLKNTGFSREKTLLYSESCVVNYSTFIHSRSTSNGALKWRSVSDPEQTWKFGSYGLNSVVFVQKRWRRPNLSRFQDKWCTRAEKLRIRRKLELNDLKENVFTVPNALCLVRIGLTPFIGYLVLDECYGVALVLFSIAGLTDLIDGAVARKFPSQQSVFGSALDPLADKLLVGVLFLSLTCTGIIPVPLTMLVVARDVLLLGASFYLRYTTLSPPRTLGRYFDVTQPTAKLKPTHISKVIAQTRSKLEVKDTARNTSE